VSAYTDQLLSLLPQGAAWPREPGSILYNLSDAMASELARVDGSLRLLENELDPNTTQLALTDFESEYGLPDRCAGEVQTIDGRRERLIGKMTQQGAQSVEFFVALARDHGFEIGVTTFPVATCVSDCDAPLYDEPWRFVFRIDAPEVTVRVATCESGCDEPLRLWGNDVLECTVRHHTHSHHYVLFGYGA
tara:strand:- start:8471 stop:9043 length:573 start_codon:yes stop_codon:yes gene_type:complete